MKTKFIENNINRKIENWLNSIKNKKVKTYIEDKIIVTGGCITSMLLNENVNDFDVYFKDKKSAKLVAQYYCDVFNKRNSSLKNKIGYDIRAWVLDGEDVEQWKQGKKDLIDFAKGYSINFSYEDKDKVSGMIVNTHPDRIKIMINSDGIVSDKDVENNDEHCEINMRKYLDMINDGDDIPEDFIDKNSKEYIPLFFSTNAITLSNKIQITLRFYGSSEDIHENFDFIHCTNYWDSLTKELHLNKKALESILTKQLIYNGSKYPICSLIRTRKFIKREWNINAGQYLKMAYQISKLDLNDINVLEDQLVGVDSLYFIAFIETLKEGIKNNDYIDQSYVTSVIDKIFN
jgi:hypothetical protein